MPTAPACCAKLAKTEGAEAEGAEAEGAEAEGGGGRDTGEPCVRTLVDMPM